MENLNNLNKENSEAGWILPSVLFAFAISTAIFALLFAGIRARSIQAQLTAEASSCLLLKQSLLRMAEQTYNREGSWSSGYPLELKSQTAEGKLTQGESIVHEDSTHKTLTFQMSLNSRHLVYFYDGEFDVEHGQVLHQKIWLRFTQRN